MEVIELNNEGLKRTFKIIHTAQEVNNRVEISLQNVKDKISLPGFRPGKVPVALIKSRYGESLRQEAVELAVQDGIRTALTERTLRPAQQPKVTNLNTEIYSDDKIDLVITVDVEILPNIEIKSFDDIKITRYVEEITDNDVAEFMNKLAENYPQSVPLKKKRAAKNGDITNIDFEGFIDGVAFAGGKGEGHNLELGSNSFIPGFEDQIIGHKIGEEFSIFVDFPENYNSPDLAGKKSEFKIKLNEILEKKPNEVNEEFAKTMGFDTLDALKSVVMGRMENQNDMAARDVQKRQLLDQLDQQYNFDLPPTMVDSDFNQLWERVQHAFDHNELDESDKGKDIETLKTEYRAIAERRVKLGLLLNEIGRREAIEVSEEEIRGRAMEQARQYPPELRNQFLKLVSENEQFRMEISLPLFEEKVTGFLIDMTTREEVSMSKADFQKKSDEIISNSERMMGGGNYHAAHEHNHDHHDHDGHDHSGHDHDGHDHSGHNH